MFEVIIRGKFSTGTTMDDPEEAKEVTKNLLLERLKLAGCLEPNDIFQFQIESIELDKL